MVLFVGFCPKSLYKEADSPVQVQPAAGVDVQRDESLNSQGVNGDARLNQRNPARQSRLVREFVFGRVEDERRRLLVHPQMNSQVVEQIVTERQVIAQRFADAIEVYVQALPKGELLTLDSSFYVRHIPEFQRLNVIHRVPLSSVFTTQKSCAAVIATHIPAVRKQHNL